MFSIIVAADLNNGIGKNNALPWSLKGDMKYFKEVTTKAFLPNEQNAVIMGRNTWISIPEKFRPLPNRLNFVLSKNMGITSTLPTGVGGATSLDSALDYVAGLPNIDKTFVIGGAQLYKEALNHQDCQEILLTRIDKIFDCDTFIPEIDNTFVLTASNKQIENGITYSFEVYKKISCCL